MPDNTGIKGAITFIVKVITPGMRWCLNINVPHVEASNTVWEVPFSVPNLKST